MRWLAVALLLLLAGCAGTAPESEVTVRPGDAPGSTPGNQFLLHAPRPAVDVRISGGAEPQILADNQGRFLWIADTSGGYVSHDNGSSWRSLPSIRPPGLFNDGWGLAQDDAGAMYAAAINGHWVNVGRSEDGTSWAHTSHAVDAAPVSDRPWLAAHGDGEVALFIYDFGRSFSESCAISKDAGVTWLDRSVLRASPQGGRASADAAGNFYIASDDGKLTRFAGSCMSTASKQMFPAGKGAQHMVHTSAQGDEVYAAAPTPGNGAVVLSGTKAWGSPRTVTVSPAVLLSNTFAVVSVHDDEVAVAWYGSESAGDPGAAGFSGSWNVFVAVVQDFWGSPKIQHHRITTEANHVGDICMDGVGCDGDRDRDLLDYFAIDHDVWGGVHVAYGHDGAGSSAEVRYAHVPPTPDPGPQSVDPVASFAATANGLRIDVDGTASHDPDGGDVTHVWSWGDGTTTTGPASSHTYDDYGAVAVTLRVQDDEGQEASAVKRFVIDEETQNVAPRASFERDPSGAVEVGTEVLFTDTSTDEDGAIVERAWRFGGATGDEDALRVTFQVPGDHVVTLTVTDDGGASASSSAVVQVDPVPEAAPEPEPQEHHGRTTPAVHGLAALVLALASRRR